jgi:hypothetical protein
MQTRTGRDNPAGPSERSGMGIGPDPGSVLPMHERLKSESISQGPKHVAVEGDPWKQKSR